MTGPGALIKTLVARVRAMHLNQNPFDWLTRDQAACLLEAQAAEIVDMHEQIAALQSREVCAAAHDNVEECGYCQRDRLQQIIERLEAELSRWKRECTGRHGSQLACVLPDNEQLDVRQFGAVGRAMRSIDDMRKDDAAPWSVHDYDWLCTAAEDRRQLLAEVERLEACRVADELHLRLEQSEREARGAEIGRLRAALLAAKREHDEECGYLVGRAYSRCTCGADAHNLAISNALIDWITEPKP